jgi:hypothetical protein
MNSNANKVFFYEDKTLNSNGNRVFFFEDKTFPSYLTPIDPFYQGNSSNLTFEDRILENLVEEVQSPSQQEFEEDDNNCMTPLLLQPPPPQEFKPQPSTFEDQILPPYQEFKLQRQSYDYRILEFLPQPSTSQGYRLPEFKAQPSTSQSHDYRIPEFKSQASSSTNQDYQPPEQIQDREDSLMRIANQFCAIRPPKSPVLAPPPTPIMRCLPNFNTFKVNDKKSSKSKILNSKIKPVIEELRGLTPTVDIRTLCFLNVLDHKYYGSNKQDHGVLIKVDFNEAVDYAFRKKFVSFTKEGKDLFLSNFVNVVVRENIFHLLQISPLESLLEVVVSNVGFSCQEFHS